MQDYKKLKVWERSHLLTLQVYKITKAYPKEEMYGITSQIRRCASSIPANIAEGCGRNTNNDMARFLQIALGSANELEYFLLLSKDLGYVENEKYLLLDDNINEIKAMLISLIPKVRGN